MALGNPTVFTKGAQASQTPSTASKTWEAGRLYMVHLVVQAASGSVTDAPTAVVGAESAAPTGRRLIDAASGQRATFVYRFTPAATVTDTMDFSTTATSPTCIWKVYEITGATADDVLRVKACAFAQDLRMSASFHIPRPNRDENMLLFLNAIGNAGVNMTPAAGFTAIDEQTGGIFTVTEQYKNGGVADQERLDISWDAADAHSLHWYVEIRPAGGPDLDGPPLPYLLDRQGETTTELVGNEIDPAPNSVLYASWDGRWSDEDKGTPAITSTLTGLVSDWEEVASTSFDSEASPNSRLVTWRAVTGDNPGAGVITITPTLTNLTSHAYQVSEHEGLDLADPDANVWHAIVEDGVQAMVTVDGIAIAAGNALMLVVSPDSQRAANNPPGDHRTWEGQLSDIGSSAKLDGWGADWPTTHTAAAAATRADVTQAWAWNGADITEVTMNCPADAEATFPIAAHVVELVVAQGEPEPQSAVQGDRGRNRRRRGRSAA